MLLSRHWSDAVGPTHLVGAEMLKEELRLNLIAISRRQCQEDVSHLCVSEQVDIVCVAVVSPSEPCSCKIIARQRRLTLPGGVHRDPARLIAPRAAPVQYDLASQPENCRSSLGRLAKARGVEMPGTHNIGRFRVPDRANGSTLVHQWLTACNGDF